MAKGKIDRADKRTPAQKGADMAFIASMVAKGYRSLTITGMINARNTYKLSERTVTRDINDLKVRWRQEETGDVSFYLQREIMLLDWVQIEAVESWERSKAEKAGEVYESKVPKSDSRSLARKRMKKLTTKVRSQGNFDGSSEYLQVILKVSERRSRLLGLDKPLSQEHSGPQGGPIPIGLPSGGMTLELAIVDETQKVTDAKNAAADGKV